MSEQDNFKTLLDAGAASVEVRSIGNGIPFSIVGEEYHAHNLESFLPVPVRKRGSIITSDSQGFIDYLNKHSTVDVSTIYADIDSEKSRCILVGVIDDHGKEGPQWRQHTCTFAPKQAVEWTRWIGKNRAVMTQGEFATWLEDNLTDIASVDGMPTGADMLGMALAFEANYDKRFKSKTNLQSGGVQFEFVDDETKDTRTTMKAFERFTIGVPVFDGSTSAYPLEARIKYRVGDGVVKFWYELIRPDRVFKTAVMDEVAAIGEGTGLQVISGTAGL